MEEEEENRGVKSKDQFSEQLSPCNFILTQNPGKKCLFLISRSVEIMMFISLDVKFHIFFLLLLLFIRNLLRQLLDLFLPLFFFSFNNS